MTNQHPDQSHAKDDSGQRQSNQTNPPSPAIGVLPIPLDELRQKLTVALLCDALDTAGYRDQSPCLPITPLTTSGTLLIGNAKTTLWEDISHEDPNPYELELAAIDSCQPDDVIVCAADGSMRSGVWGELLSSAAVNRGCCGAVVDGAVRDQHKMRQLKFPVYARGANPYDSQHRQRVSAYDVPINLGGVTVHPGDLIAADDDGIAIVPRAIQSDVILAAWDKATAENEMRIAVQGGMSATAAYERFGVL
ncbi:RraA family protein [Allorhodopirellula solitaria]|uniref:Putative 4-hydroxy-4-methyl-2-oxoglutarate aldolase n=1 Tax=Allorhodopirellula solitaria TaxID=2527987 RepID=A0A5C5XQ18_9BACT|nr:RraA family protein [Allorhodopirellula solitaria]TWT65326.1 4-hydroxy-4-methyl-2-oxoglutarate aldolase [Allorhodopirellula solitaria]